MHMSYFRKLLSVKKSYMVSNSKCWKLLKCLDYDRGTYCTSVEKWQSGRKKQILFFFFFSLASSSSKISLFIDINSISTAAILLNLHSIEVQKLSNFPLLPSKNIFLLKVVSELELYSLVTEYKAKISTNSGKIMLKEDFPSS